MASIYSRCSSSDKLESRILDTSSESTSGYVILLGPSTVIVPSPLSICGCGNGGAGFGIMIGLPSIGAGLYSGFNSFSPVSGFTTSFTLSKITGRFSVSLIKTSSLNSSRRASSSA